MKKFTFIVFVLLISVGLNAQMISDAVLKLQNIQNKYSTINQQFARIDKLTKTTFMKPDFKSAVFSQQLDSTVSQIFDIESQIWQKDYKDEFLFDQEMGNTIWTEKAWNRTTHTWDFDFKAEFSFNNDGRVTVVEIYDKDLITKMPVLSGKYNYYYNSDGMADSVLTWYTEDAGANWELITKQEHQYNSSKQLIETETWSFDEDESVLVLMMKTDLTYNENGKIDTTTASLLLDGDEIANSKSVYNYYSSGKVSSIEYYNLNYLTLNLEKNSRDTFQYNANDDVSAQIYSTWTGTGWSDEDKDVFEYHAMDLSDVAYPDFIVLFNEEDGINELNYGKAVKTINTYEMIEDDWLHTETTTFYYSDSSTDINKIVSAGFKIYPNPALENIIFKWKENSRPLLLKMYKVTGAKVLEQNTWSGKEISVAHLDKGIYFFNLVDGQQIVYSGKIAKR